MLMLNLSHDEFIEAVLGYTSNKNLEAIDNIYANNYITGRWYMTYDFEDDPFILMLRDAERVKQVKLLQEAIDV